MIASVLFDTPIRMLEQTMSFTEQRHEVLLEDIANASTPGHVQKDLSVDDFQGALRDAIDRQQNSISGDDYQPESGENVEFEPGGSQVFTQSVEKPGGMPFHDRGVRSMEYIMSDLADNALAHNMAAQFLKSRYDLLSRAISMRV